MSLPPAPRRRFRAAAPLGVAGAATLAAIAVVVALNIGGWRERLLGRPVGEAIRSVAVLPFENLSGDPQNAYFSDGIGEKVLSRLASIPGLKVVSVRRVKGQTLDASRVGREVGAVAVLEGGVRREGNRVRVTPG